MLRSPALWADGAAAGDEILIVHFVSQLAEITAVRIGVDWLGTVFDNCAFVLAAIEQACGADVKWKSVSLKLALPESRRGVPHLAIWSDSSLESIDM